MLELFLQSLGAGLGFGIVVAACVVLAGWASRTDERAKLDRRLCDVHERNAVSLEIRNTVAMQQERRLAQISDALVTIAANQAEEMELRLRMANAADALVTLLDRLDDEYVREPDAEPAITQIS